VNESEWELRKKKKKNENMQCIVLSRANECVGGGRG
jgi:hypothetical protein